MPTTFIDAKDVQGLVRFGYARLTEGCYLLLRIRDAAAASAWCAVAPVATAESQERPPETALQVAFTWAGLGKLGLPSNVLAGFSPEFQSGMAGEENRSRRLGDVGANATEACWSTSPSARPRVAASGRIGRPDRSSGAPSRTSSSSGADAAHSAAAAVSASTVG